MAFCGDDDDDDGAGEEEEGNAFSFTQSPSCHVICWFLAVSPSYCHLSWCVKRHTRNPKTNESRVQVLLFFLIIIIFFLLQYLGNVLGAFF